MTEDGKSIFQSLAGPLRSYPVTSLQVNLGLLCNLNCNHCHLAASPQAEEIMPWAVMQQVIRAVDNGGITLVDITGGAPELNPNLRNFIRRLKRPGLDIKLRTNLVALVEPGQEGLAEFLRDNNVGLVASLPCYEELNVRAQRGNGVFEKSIGALKMLNGLGYGREGEIKLDLVYNPGGAFLPGGQEELETTYRRELQLRYGICFNRLLVITNMPIGRFRNMLSKNGQLKGYLDLLHCSFNRGVLCDLMCRSQVSVGWNGTLYDCDFNLALGYPVSVEKTHIAHFNREAFSQRFITAGDHCLGCTAGAGSSCRGSLAEGAE